MSNIDFQNGLLVGMTAKGMVNSRQAYVPEVWNDAGEYSYFYIDFKRAVVDFSTGMISDSFVVYGTSSALSISSVERISASVFKVSCSFSGSTSLLVANKEETYIQFITGDKVPPFSINMEVSGASVIFKAGYAYDRVDVNITTFFKDLAVDLDFTTYFTLDAPADFFAHSTDVTSNDICFITFP